MSVEGVAVIDGMSCALLADKGRLRGFDVFGAAPRRVAVGRSRYAPTPCRRALQRRCGSAEGRGARPASQRALFESPERVFLGQATWERREQPTAPAELQPLSSGRAYRRSPSTAIDE
jgi:hypothetical protein